MAFKSLSIIVLFSILAFSEAAWNLSTRQIFYRTSANPPARQEAAVVYVDETNTTYIFGGRSGSSVYSDVWYSVFPEYPNPTAWSRITLPQNATAPSPRYGMVFGLWYNQGTPWLIIAGGATEYPYDLENSTSFSSETWGFNLVARNWILISSGGIPPIYSARGGIYHRDDYLWLTHGLVSSGPANLTYRLDLTQGLWSAVPLGTTSPSGRFHHGVALIRPNQLVLFGGCIDTTSPCSANQETWIYNYQSGWSRVTGGGPPSARHSFLFSKFGYNTSSLAVLYGGSAGSREAWYFDVSSGLWIQITYDRGSELAVPPGRTYTGHIWRPALPNTIQSSFVVMYGGVLLSSNGTTNDIFLFLGNTGMDVAPVPPDPTNPPNRNNPSNEPDGSIHLIPLFLLNIFIFAYVFLF